MRRVEASFETTPLDDATVASLKDAGHRVYRSEDAWRVVMTVTIEGTETVHDQVSMAIARLRMDLNVQAVDSPARFTLRDPDSLVDAHGTALIVNETMRSYDPDPKPRPKRKWYQVAMELGLGERKV